MSLVDSEQVLVIPTPEFHRFGYFQGFCSDVGRFLPELFHSESLNYRPRREMEKDPGFKQLIPYVVFRYTADGEVRLFQYYRGQGQGEARLRSKRSVGVGGHISTLDAAAAQTSGGDVYEEGLQRELDEEVVVDTTYSSRCVGLINDDETEVGKVHLGIVHLYDVDTPAIRPREADILDAGFRPVSELLANLDEFESWSQIVLRALFA